jgi:hypothetical protein
MYRAEFDVKRPRPGDVDLAAAIKKGRSLALEAASPGEKCPECGKGLWTEFNAMGGCQCVYCGYEF